jgi:peptidoglycan/xylan/chitin deacetylase (PgdA/CDA1 family)/GT2 family glycosyltransferase
LVHDSATASVVVPTYNRRQSLARTLPPLLSQSFPADRYEVVVVVDGSTDGTSAFLNGLHPECGLRVVEQANQGLAAARNAGVRAARGGLIIFIDDDIDCAPTLVAAHVNAHGGDGGGVVLGPTLVAADSQTSLVSDQEGAWRRQWIEGLDEHRQPRWPVDFWVGHNSSIARAVFLAHGGYDETFLKFEEYELGFRLRKSGVRFRWQPAARTYHVNAKSARQVLSEDAPSMGKGEFALCRAHPEYRPSARLAGLAQGGLCKRLLRQAGVRTPLAAPVFWRTPLEGLERLCMGRSGWLRSQSGRLLNLNASLVAYRAALAEAGSWEALSREFAMRLPVLVYHRVGPPIPNTWPGLSISPEQFERQIRWLSEHRYSGIQPSDWRAWRNEGKPLPPKPILVTFDDGYADTAEYAFPILRRYGMRAGAFVVTGNVGATNVWDEARGYVSLKLMTEDQIRRWSHDGIEFGSHSRSHPDLTALSPERLEAEIAGSAEDLERITGVRPVSFAYPHGCYDETVSDCTNSAFDLAFTAEGGLNDLGTDPQMLHRSAVASSDWSVEFGWMVRTGRRPIQHLRERIHLRNRATASAERLRADFAS